MGLPASPPFDPRYGEGVEVARHAVRVTAGNSGPFTGPGTNSYVLGTGTLAVVDPGPDDPRHLEALLRVIAGRPVSHVVVTHTHVDHTALVGRLVEATGALTVAEGRHRAARELQAGERNTMDASADGAFEPDRKLAHGEVVEGDGWTLQGVHTPGHTANHMAFAVPGGPLFCGDHVMAWATTIVAPPDGSMTDYMASLETLLDRQAMGLDSRYLPGHGAAIDRPRAYVRALKAHRLMRERAVLDRIRAGDRTIPEIVAVIYRATDARLHGAAALSVLAQLERLVERGAVRVDGAPSLAAEYRPA